MRAIASAFVQRAARIEGTLRRRRERRNDGARGMRDDADGHAFQRVARARARCGEDARWVTDARAGGRCERGERARVDGEASVARGR